MNVLEAQNIDLKLFDLPGIKQHRLVFLNGVYSENDSRINGLPPGVVLEALSKGRGLALSIPDKVIVEELVHMLFFSINAGNAARPLSFSTDILIRAGASTRLKMVVDELSLGEARTESERTFETRLAPGACVNFYQIQRGGKGTSVSTNRFYLKQHSDLEFFNFVQGGDVTRSDNEVHFEGEHGFCSLKGLAVLDGASQVVNRIKAYHKVPRCISRQFYKNILSDKSKSEFNSLVHVLKGALKSDSQQLNKNILLSDEAQARVQPQLRIDADDVACTHGATVGQLEKDELFYLTSRGLSKEVARFLLTYGFAEEILEGVEPAVLREELETLVKNGLQKASGNVGR